MKCLECNISDGVDDGEIGLCPSCQEKEATRIRINNKFFKSAARLIKEVEKNTNEPAEEKI